MSDALRLLFELDVDGRPGAAGLQRFRKEIAATVNAARRAITQPLKAPNTAPITAAATATAKAAASAQELANRTARATQAAQRLQIGEQRLAASAVQLTAAQQRATNAHTQAAAGAIRAATAYQRATVAANNFAQAVGQNVRRAITSVQSGLRSIGQGLQTAGRALSVGITAPLLTLGAISLKSAKDLDANVNTLKAFTGSAQSAEIRLAELIKTSRQTPGLTTNLSLTLDAQLRVAKTTQETIDRVLPAIGRLNAVSKLPDAARFTQNLLQLVTQNFEKQDLKELVGQSPLAGQLITEIFKVDSPTNAKAIRAQAKKLGLTSVDAFFTAFAEAAARNQGLANVTESIGTRFDKLTDRVTVALRPLGLAIINAIEPFIEPVARLIERIGDAFTALSQPVKTAIIVIAGLAAAVGPVLIVVGSLATGIAAVVSAVGTVAAAVTAVGLPVIAAVVAVIVVEIGKWIVILTTLGLAWKTNFLNIRELTADAASAVVEALGRIKAIILEATERILPTLQSITGKVLGALTDAWNKYGKDIVRVVGAAFTFTTRVIETFLTTFANVIDLLLKLIDGDFKGAWAAFARIVLAAVAAFGEALDKLPVLLAQAFGRLHAIILAEAIKFIQAGQVLALNVVIGLTKGLVKSNEAVRDALVDMFLLAAQGFDPNTIAAILIGKIINALRNAASQGVTVPVTAEPEVGGEPVIGAGILRKKKPPTVSDEIGKGADAATRQRIRLLELEADKAEAIKQQAISAENILFDQRKTSLKDFTDFQIREEEFVLKKKKEVFAAERAEAEKLGKGRELALAEIRLKEKKADLEFVDKRNQLLANKDRAELEAAKTHRQALLDIQDQADAAELARLEDFRRRGAITAFDLASRQAEIEKAARERHRKELEIQLKEADQNQEDREKALDELKKFDEESAESVRRNERLKREAVQETSDSYRDYVLAIREALEATIEAARDAAAVAATRLAARVFLTQRERIQRQFALDTKALEAEKKASALRVDNAEREAVEKAKKAGTFGEQALKIEKTFNDLRLAEQKRFRQQADKLEEDRKAGLERVDPSSRRSLFGDLFADTAEATGSVLQGLLATGQDVFEQLSSQVGNMRDIMVSAFSAIGQAVGDAAQAFVLYGSAGTSFKKFAAQVVAGLAAMAATKAIFELAEGFAALARGFFGNPKAFAEAAMHFKSAAIYGIVAGVSALAGRAVAGNSFSDNKETASSAVSGGESQPNNRNLDSNGSGSVETSLQAAREGSTGSMFGRLAARIEAFQQQSLEVQRQQQLHNAQVAQALTKLGTARPGDVVTMGAADARQAIGVAVIDHSNASGDFNEALQRNLGFAN